MKDGACDAELLEHVQHVRRGLRLDAFSLPIEPVFARRPITAGLVAPDFDVSDVRNVVGRP